MQDHPRNNHEAQQAEEQRSRESLVQALVGETRKLLENGDSDSALSFFRQMHPADQADVLVELAGDTRRKLVTELGTDENAEILEHIEPEDAVRVLEGIDTQVVSRILDEASPDVAADILKDLPLDRSLEILKGMQEAGDVIPLLKHASDTAGGLMVPDYPMVREGISAANALDLLRLMGPRAEDFGSVYVVDDANKLVGSLSITRLALARPHMPVSELVDRDIVSVSTETDQEEMARLMERYNLNELPVLDQEGRLAGVVLSEDMVDVLEAEATEDMYRMVGVAGERVMGPLRNSLKNRLPWLYLYLGAAFLSALVISLFESTISRFVALAVFLPVVAGQGGIAGTQTVTLVVRSMALGELPARMALRLLAREASLGVVNGVLLGLVVGLVAFAWRGDPMLGAVLSVAMVGNLVVAALAGAGVPLLLRRLKLDPAVSSTVFVTTFTDVLGFLLFLGLATLALNFLA